jgi:hypothetical protein
METTESRGGIAAGRRTLFGLAFVAAVAAISEADDTWFQAIPTPVP